MEEILKKLNSPLLEIQATSDYLSQFQNYELISEDIKKDYGTITILCEGELIKISFVKIVEGNWWSIYRFHADGVKYEQIDVLVFDVIKDDEYNKVIKYSGHVEDEIYSYIECSGFTYLNNDFVSSWKSTRVVPVEELAEIQYSKRMNLTELICMADMKSSNIIKKENLKNIKTLVLKLEKVDVS